MKDSNETNGTTPLDSKARAESMLSGESNTAMVLQDRRGVDLPLIFENLEDVQPLPGISARKLGLVDAPPGAFAVSGPSAMSYNTAREELTSQSIFPHPQEVQFTAQLVVEDDRHCGGDSDALRPAEEEVIEGRILQETKDVEQEGIPQKKAACWMLAILCFIAALALMLVFLLGPPEQDTSEKAQLQSGSSSPQTAQYPPFQSNLSHEVTAAIQDVESPFHMANAWVLKDPYLSSYSPSRQAQRFYLAMLYYATNGDGWITKDNWLSYEVSECDWYSRSSFSEDSKYFPAAVCDSSNATVISLSLASNNLTGSLPMWYTSFIPQLRILDLANNHIGGALPTMTSTPLLEIFVLSNNPFEGAVRLNAGAFFDNIKVIKVDGTLLRGNNGGKFYYVISKDLEIHNMTGMPNDMQIWSELGMMTSLEYWGISHSNITGTIATELGLATSLRQFEMSSLPYMYGTIPSELGLLTHLTLWDLSETPITGMVPAPLCDRVHAGLLEMHANCSTLQCCSDS